MRKRRRNGLIKSTMRTCVVLGAAVLVGGIPGAHAQVAEYYHLDGLRSVRAVTDASGSIMEGHDYLPYGEECTTGPCASNPGIGAGQPLKFTGKERDAETGLDYVSARYYGSRIGRFTSVDPLQTQRALIDPQQWNRYAYARGNPLRYVDPTGLYVFDESVTTEEKERFRKARADARSAANDLSAGEHWDIREALDAYGRENDDDTVTVSFARIEKGPETRRGARPGTYKVVINSELTDANALAGAVAHEGVHVKLGGLAFRDRRWDAWWNDRSDGVPAYTVSIAVAKGLGQDELRFRANGVYYEIWNRKQGIQKDTLASLIRLLGP